MSKWKYPRGGRDEVSLRKRKLEEQTLGVVRAYVTEKLLREFSRHPKAMLDDLKRMINAAGDSRISRINALLEDWRPLRLEDWRRPLRPVQLPSAAQFALILLSRKRRDDVLNDLWDWYPGWIKEHYGRRVWANFSCFVKIAAAFFGQGLDVLYRIREVVGKFRGRAPVGCGGGYQRRRGFGSTR